MTSRAGPGSMFSTISVPAGVPSLFHSSLPFPSSAAKKSVPATSTSPDGDEPSGPTLMSATISVPVPSLFHSSRPLTPSSAAKYSVPLITVSCSGDESPAGLMSRTIAAPGAADAAGAANATHAIAATIARPRVTPSMVRRPYADRSRRVKQGGSRSGREAGG